MNYKIDDYELCKPLGEGEFGEVFFGIHFKQLCPRAIKVLRPKYRKADRVLERFVREAQVGSVVQSQFVVEVLDLGETQTGEPFIAMRLASDQTFSKWLNTHRIHTRSDLETLVIKIEQILAGVQAVHNCGYIHRDIKPNNILMSEGSDPVPMIADFGCALSTKDAKNQTVTKGLYTAGFASPEQVSNANSAGFESDVWSVGAILYLGLTGKFPFDVKSEMLESELAEQLAGELIPPSAHGVSSLDHTLDAICCKSLTSDRELRYKTATDFAEDLRRWRTHMPVPGIDGFWARNLKFAQQYRHLAIFGGIVFLSLFIGLVGVGWGWRQDHLAKQDLRRVLQQESMAREQARQSQRTAIELLADIVFDLNPLLQYQSGAGAARANVLRKIPRLIDSLESSEDTEGGWDRTELYSVLSLADILEEFAGTLERASVDQLQVGMSAAPVPNVERGDLKQWLTYTRQLRDRAVVIAKNILSKNAADKTAIHDYLVALNALSKVQQTQGEYASALTTAKSSLSFFDSLSVDKPDSDDRLARDLAVTHERIAHLHKQMGSPAKAHEHYARQRQILECLAEGKSWESSAMRDWALSLGAAGVLLRETGKLDECRPVLEQSYEIRKQRSAVLTREIQAQRDLADADLQLGHLESTVNQPKKALQHFSDAVEMLRRLHSQNPSHFDLARSLATGLQNVGDVNFKLRDMKASNIAYLECIALRETLARQATEAPTIQLELAISRSNYSLLLEEEQRLDEALMQLKTAYQDCMALEIDQYDTEQQRTMLICSNRIGRIFLKQKKTVDAEHWYGRGLSLSRNRFERVPSSSEAVRDLAIALSNLGDLYEKSGQLDKAIEHYQEARDRAQEVLDKKDIAAVVNVCAMSGRLGGALAANGQHAQAAAQFQQAINEIEQVQQVEKAAFLQIALAKLLRTSALNSQATLDFAMARTQLQKAIDVLSQLEAKGQLTAGDRAFASELNRNLGAAKLKESSMQTWEILIRDTKPVDLPHLLDVRQFLLLGVKRYEESLQAAQKLSELDGLSDAQWYNIACVRSRVAEDRSKPDSSPDQRQQSEELKRQAVAALKKSIELGWSNIEHLKNDSDLAAIRATNEFQTLLQGR